MFYEGIQTLIDATRDAFSWTLENRPDAALELARGWIQSEVPLLERIGIHSIEKTDLVDPNAKLRLLIDEDWLDESDARGEVLRLAATAYPQAEPSTRTRLIEQARARFMEAGDVYGSPVDEERKARRFWGFLRRLHEADPSCELVERVLGEVEEEHPDLRPRKVQPPVEIPSARTLLRLVEGRRGRGPGVARLHYLG